jgi:AcrR family transcriptional regulator
VPTQLVRRATTERAILDAALSLYLERSSPEPSLDDVAERAGVAKSTVLYHFQSRMGQLEGLASRLYEEMGARVGPLDRYADARAFLRAFLFDALEPTTRVFQQIGDQLLYATRGTGLGRGVRSLINALETFGVTDRVLVVAAATQMVARQLAFGHMVEDEIDPFLDDLLAAPATD